jgi:protein-tyrosine phosphatase
MSTHYTFVSPTVAIGDIYSSYDDFDVIVNLSNNAKVDIGNILFEKVESRQIVHIGLIDRPNQKELCKDLWNRLRSFLYTQKDKRILFHCNSGKSRSATFAVLFLSLLLSKNAVEVLDDVKQKRPIVEPNQGFMEIIMECKAKK